MLSIFRMVAMPRLMLMHAFAAAETLPLMPRAL